MRRPLLFPCVINAAILSGIISRLAAMAVFRTIRITMGMKSDHGRRVHHRADRGDDQHQQDIRRCSLRPDRDNSQSPNR